MPVNLRNKLPGESNRVAGSVIANMGIRCDISVDNKNIMKDAVAKRLHNAIRSGLSFEKLYFMERLQNYIWREDNSLDWHDDKEAGDVLLGGLPGYISWNSQSSNPFYEIDFGAGPPLRGVPWNFKQPVTIMKTSEAQGDGLDVYIFKGARGHVSWKTVPRTWTRTSNALWLGALGGAVVMSKRDVGWPFPALWFSSLALLAHSARKRAQTELNESKEKLFNFARDNARRGIACS